MWLFVLFILPAQARAQAIGDPLNITSSPCVDRNHIFLAPGVLTAGGTSRSCVSRFHTDGPANMLLTLTTEGETVSASRDLAPGDGGCLDISVPQRPNSKAELNVNIRYPDAKCTWERRISLRIASGRVVVVHTERARYRPGDVLRIRAIALKADLTPAHSNIEEIWLEGPRGAWDGVKIAEWSRVRTRLGLAQVQYQLDELAPPGKWTVRARLVDGSQGSVAFWVGNYELPPFQLTVRHSPKILRTSERLVWTVCVRYPWSEAVEGMLVIRLRGAGGSEGTGIRTAVRLKAPRACHRHAAAARRIGLDGEKSPDVVVADFSFQEEGTRVWQNTTVVSQVVDDPVTLEFVTKHRAVISPGLPNKIKIKATRWDGKPSPSSVIRVCRVSSPNHSINSTSSCTDSSTDEKGLATLVFTAPSASHTTGTQNHTSYYFKATLNNATAYLQAWSAPNARASLGPLRAEPRTLLPLYLAIPTRTSITVHFVVITRGGIIYRWGATTQCPTTTDKIHTSQRNAICPDVEPATFSNNTEFLTDRLAKVFLPIKVSQQMCPDSHLMAYFYYNNELVVASKHFEMDECFHNKVEATWASRLTLPGSLTNLTLTTPGPALCALTVLDTASKWTQPGESVKDLIMTSLRRLMDSHRNLTEHDAAGECFLTSDSPDLPTTGSELLSSWLASAGVRLFGENLQRHCSSAELLLSDDALVPRSDFSESWLWRLVAVGNNNTAYVSARAPDSITRYEASAFCLARTGLSISQPAVLQVFREFFIHASSPRRLKRGDTAIIPYRIFNYQYKPLNVEVQITTDEHLHTPNTRETVTIPARSSAARRLEASRRVAGVARLKIRATADNVSDEVIILIEVDAEGVPVQEYKSALLCGRESPSFTSAPDISWSWTPVQAVPGTEAISIWATGDTFGPLLFEADQLVQLPRGCGEQNMARLATNLLSLTLSHTRSSVYLRAKDHVARGFTRQLQYVHPAGGFSAFGASDPSPSTWLTAFCVRYLRRAYKVLSGNAPIPPAILQAERWLINQQMENGCFRNQGHVFHNELKGGLNEDGEISNVALTAYVITSLLETSVSSKIIRNSLSCLRALPTKTKKVYAYSIISYAYMKLRKFEELSNEVGSLKDDEELGVLLRFLEMGKRSGGFVWWDTGNLATSIEATGYALLALASCPSSLSRSCSGDVAGAARWLATHRSASGGFISTQDTLVALEGLSHWSDLLPTASNVTVTVQNEQQRKQLHLKSNTKIPEIMKIAVSEHISVSVHGPGCALVQATRSYNSLSPEQSNDDLSVSVSVHTQGPFNCFGEVCFCAAVVEVCTRWIGSFPVMALLEVSLPSGYAADAEKLYSQLQTNDTLLRRIELSPNSGKASLYLGTRDGSDTISRAGHVCYNFHTVGPRAKTKPAHAKIIDYYNPHVMDTQMYTIPEDCPSQINEDINKYHSSDNLFDKARSLTDSGEIVISHEYSFEDIPEGIPLEDPIYDNLTKKDEDESDVKIEIINDIDQNKPLDANEISDYDGTIREERVLNEVGELNKVSDKSDQNDVSEIAYKNNVSISAAHVHEELNKKIQINEGNTIKEHEIQIKEESKDINTTNKDYFKATNEAIKNKNFEEFQKQNNNKNVVIKQEIHNAEEKVALNPSFHVIDSERDLDVPSGLEGPIPAYVLPPKNFVPPLEIGLPQYSQTWRSFPRVPFNQYYQPLYYKQNYYTKYKPINVAT